MESLVIDPLTEFFEAIRSPVTKDRYEHRLDIFLKFISSEGKELTERAASFANKAKSDPQWATFKINEYMRFQKSRAEKGEIAESTLANFWKPIKLFTEQNDIVLNWKKITRRVPTGRNYANDRAPTLEEIVRILGYHDRRIKPIVLPMTSGGFRVGAWNYLHWEDIKPFEKNGIIVAASVKIYSGTKDEYTTFITAEAYKSLNEWMNSRSTAGEKVIGKSWVMRDLWEAQITKNGSVQQRGLAVAPKQLTSTGIMRLIQRALFSQGLREKLEPGKRRYEFQADHGFRKFFKTVCEGKLKTLYAEIFLGHDTGLSESYYRPSEDELLTEYLKVAPYLSIFEKPAIANEDIAALKRLLDESRIELAEAKKGREQDRAKFDAILEKIDKRFEEIEKLQPTNTTKTS